MAGTRIVILGAGFGGITAALELRRVLSADHTVTVIDQQREFMMGLRKLWILTGRGTRREGSRDRAALRGKGIDLRQTSVTGIEPTGRNVRTADGDVPFDYLIIALGAEPRPDLVPGFSPSAYNLYDAVDVERLAGRLQSFGGGRIAIGVLGLPYKCPPAPYEAAMMLADVFSRRGIRDAVQLEVFTLQPMSLPVVGAAGCAAVEGQLASRGIAFAPNRKVIRLDGSTAVFDGTAVDADILIGVPPHRPPRPVADSGLKMAGEWVWVDPATLRTSADGIFAVGDVTEISLANKMTLPKAGVFAEAQGNVVAAAIAAEIHRAPSPAPFDGHGYCFIEVGGEQAAMVRGEFLTAPAPTVEIIAPSADAYRQKVEFERSRLAGWFT